MSAAAPSGNTHHSASPRDWEKIAAFAFGVVFVVTMLVLAIAFPKPTSFQYEIFRIVLSLACGGVAAVIPGFLAVSMDKAGIAIRGGGALAVFLLVYFFNPAQLVASPSSVDVSAIVNTLEARYADQLAASKEREISYQDQLSDLTEAVTALAKKALT